MAKSNRTGVERLFAAKRQALVERILPRMGRVMGNVIAKEARERCVSDEVRATIKVRVETIAGGKVRVTILTSGKGAYKAPWLEYGTDPHFISVLRDEQGRFSGSLSQGNARKSLVIAGNYVGATVLHPGARRIPFMRPALDLKMADAVQAGQRYAARAMRGLEAEAEASE